MGSITATRYHDICAGHRVHGQGGKCEHLHGHNYRFHFTIESKNPEALKHDGSTVGGVDEVGRVLDFSVMKEVLCEWLEQNWDHKMLLWEKDPFYAYVKDIDATAVRVPFNPTAENMAKHMVLVVAPLLFSKAGIQCVLIRCTIDETAKCSATYSL